MNRRHWVGGAAIGGVLAAGHQLGTEGNIGGIPATGRTGESNVGRTNWDGIVGVKGRWHFGAEHRWFVPYYVDIGTGDSDFTWQAMAGIGYSWAHWDVWRRGATSTTTWGRAGPSPS